MLLLLFLLLGFQFLQEILFLNLSMCFRLFGLKHNDELTSNEEFSKSLPAEAALEEKLPYLWLHLRLQLQYRGAAAVFPAQTKRL